MNECQRCVELNAMLDRVHKERETMAAVIDQLRAYARPRRRWWQWRS